MPHAKTWRAQAFGPAFILSNRFGVAQRFTDQWPWDGLGMALDIPVRSSKGSISSTVGLPINQIYPNLTNSITLGYV